jgi:hypothetical protein
MLMHQPVQVFSLFSPYLTFLKRQKSLDSWRREVS